MRDRNDILEIVRSLKIRLESGGSTDAERATCLKLIAKYMEEFQISEKDIHKNDIETYCVTFDPPKDKHSAEEFILGIAAQFLNLFIVNALNSDKKVIGIHVSGPPEVIEHVEYFYNELARQIEPALNDFENAVRDFQGHKSEQIMYFQIFGEFINSPIPYWDGTEEDFKHIAKSWLYGIRDALTTSKDVDIPEDDNSNSLIVTSEMLEAVRGTYQKHFEDTIMKNRSDSIEEGEEFMPDMRAYLAGHQSASAIKVPEKG